MFVEGATDVGPVLLSVRSGFGAAAGLTNVVTDAFVVKFWADFVPLTLAVFWRFVLPAAVTWPVIVIRTLPCPLIVPIWQVTTLPLAPPWVHGPWVLVIVSWGRPGGLWIVPTPLTWSFMTTLSTFAPPVFLMSIVYVSRAPDATGLGFAVFVTCKGLAGSAKAGATAPGCRVNVSSNIVPTPARAARAKPR